MAVTPDEKQLLLSFAHSVSGLDMSRTTADGIVQELQLWHFNDDTLQFVRKYTGHVQRDGVLLHSCFAGNSRNYVMSASEGRPWHRF